MFRNVVRRYSSLPPNALKPAFGAPNKAAAAAFQKSLDATEHHAVGTSSLWMKISLWVAVPAILAAGVNTYFVEKEHAEHRKHLAHVPDADWPRDYEFQNLRTKPFFWGNGDRTMFWNPVVNRHINHDE